MITRRRVFKLIVGLFVVSKVKADIPKSSKCKPRYYYHLPEKCKWCHNFRVRNQDRDVNIFWDEKLKIHVEITGRNYQTFVGEILEDQRCRS